MLRTVCIAVQGLARPQLKRRIAPKRMRYIKKHFTMKEGDPLDEGLVLKAADFTVPVGVEGEKKQIGFCS